MTTFEITTLSVIAALILALWSFLGVARVILIEIFRQQSYATFTFWEKFKCGPVVWLVWLLGKMIK